MGTGRCTARQTDWTMVPISQTWSEMHTYEEIGRGTFGVVFCSQTQPDTAVKKTFKSRGTLAMEFEYSIATSFAVNMTSTVLHREFHHHTPRVPWYLSSHGMARSAATDPWWTLNRSRLPPSNGDNVPNGIFLFERIPAVPRTLQELLVRRFWPREQQQEALGDADNKDCMIRPYLQERWAYYDEKENKRLNNEQKKSLRNFPAYLDDLESMGFNCHAIATQIGFGLAVGNWEAQHDMTEVEFVIAGRREESPSTAKGNTIPLDAYDKRVDDGNRSIMTTRQAASEQTPKHMRDLPANTQMWLVDFDKCSRVCVWEASLDRDICKIALGICANDPYYPSPLPDTRLGWDVFITFSEMYIRASQTLLQRAFDKVATDDEQMQHVLQRPVMVMGAWTKIVMDAKKNNERDVYEELVRILREGGWPRPAWST